MGGLGGANVDFGFFEGHKLGKRILSKVDSKFAGSLVEVLTDGNRVSRNVNERYVLPVARSMSNSDII